MTVKIYLQVVVHSNLSRRPNKLIKNLNIFKSNSNSSNKSNNKFSSKLDKYNSSSSSCSKPLTHRDLAVLIGIYHRRQVHNSKIGYNRDSKFNSREFYNESYLILNANSNYIAYDLFRFNLI